MNHSLASLKIMRVGLLLALIAILYGFLLGVLFGGFNDQLKGHLKREAQAVLETKYGGNQEKADKVLDKALTYIRRAHLHAASLGNSAVVLIILLSILPVPSTMLLITSLSIGIGSLGYSVYWMVAGLIAPRMGSQEAAKESLSWLAIPSSALCVIGVLLTSWFTIKFLFRKFDDLR